ncbi:MAG: type III effector [Gammaproteobacteria bacterium]|nr:MAG: type III effector [Gammaproteobacteria bacterium]
MRQQPETVAFSTVIDTINQYYEYTPSHFFNGKGEDMVTNIAGKNEGSCKIFAFARLHGLTEAETLACFGDYYRQDVLQHPDGNDHANIRSFMRHGWDGIVFSQQVLTVK